MDEFFITYESASVKVDNWGDGRATLSSLYSKQRRLGHATQVLTKATKYADDNDLILILEVGSDLADNSMTNAQLFKFYQSFGFIRKYHGGMIMERPLVEYS